MRQTRKTHRKNLRRYGQGPASEGLAYSRRGTTTFLFSRCVYAWHLRALATSCPYLALIQEMVQLLVVSIMPTDGMINKRTLFQHLSLHGVEWQRNQLG